MALSNAERQKRFREKLKAQARSGMNEHYDRIASIADDLVYGLRRDKAERQKRSKTAYTPDADRQRKALRLVEECAEYFCPPPQQLIEALRLAFMDSERIRAHGLADAMREEPCRLVCDFQNAVKLVRADALLAGAHQVDRLEPLVQRQVAFLEDRADANRELLAALAALVEAVTFDTLGVLLGRLRANAGQLVEPIHAAAMRADGTLRPQDCLNVLEGCGFIVKVGLRQDGHGFNLNALKPNYESLLGLSSV